MTNTEGGVLFLGVEDNGDITGVHKHHTDEIGAAALIANRTVPSVPVRTELMHEEGYDVLKIEIPMSKTIVASSDGKISVSYTHLLGSGLTGPQYFGRGQCSGNGQPGIAAAHGDGVNIKGWRKNTVRTCEYGTEMCIRDRPWTG